MARRSQQELPPPILMKRSLLRREGSDVLGIKEEEEEDNDASSEEEPVAMAPRRGGWLQRRPLALVALAALVVLLVSSRIRGTAVAWSRSLTCCGSVFFFLVLLPEALGKTLSWLVSGVAMFGQIDMVFKGVRIFPWIAIDEGRDASMEPCVSRPKTCYVPSSTAPASSSGQRNNALSSSRDGRPTRFFSSRRRQRKEPLHHDDDDDDLTMLVPPEAAGAATTTTTTTTTTTCTPKTTTTTTTTCCERWKAFLRRVLRSRVCLEIRIKEFAFHNPKFYGFCRERFVTASDVEIVVSTSVEDFLRLRFLFRAWSWRPRDQPVRRSRDGGGLTYGVVRDPATKTWRNRRMLGVLDLERFDVCDAEIAFERANKKLNICAIGEALARGELRRHCLSVEEASSESSSLSSSSKSSSSTVTAAAATPPSRRAAFFVTKRKPTRLRVDVLAARHLDSASGAAHRLDPGSRPTSVGRRFKTDRFAAPSCFARILVRGQERRSRTILRSANPSFRYEPSEAFFVDDPSAVVHVGIFEEGPFGDNLVAQFATTLKQLILDPSAVDGGEDALEIKDDDAIVDRKGFVPLRDAKWRVFTNVEFAEPERVCDKPEDVEFVDHTTFKTTTPPGMTARISQSSSSSSSKRPHSGGAVAPTAETTQVPSSTSNLSGGGCGQSVGEAARSPPAPGYPAVLIRIRWDAPETPLAEPEMTTMEQLKINSFETAARCGQVDAVRAMLATFPYWLDVRGGFRLRGEASISISDLFLGKGQGTLERRRAKHGGTLLPKDWRAAKRNAIHITNIEVPFPVYDASSAAAQQTTAAAAANHLPCGGGGGQRCPIEAAIASVFGTTQVEDDDASAGGSTKSVGRTSSSSLVAESAERSSERSSSASSSSSVMAACSVAELPGLLTLDAATGTLIRGLVARLVSVSRVSAAVGQIAAAVGYGALSTTTTTLTTTLATTTATSEEKGPAAENPRSREVAVRRARALPTTGSKFGPIAGGTRFHRQMYLTLGLGRSNNYKKFDARGIEDAEKAVACHGILLKKSSKKTSVPGSARWRPCSFELRGATLFYHKVSPSKDQRRIGDDYVVDLRRIVCTIDPHRKWDDDLPQDLRVAAKGDVLELGVRLGTGDVGLVALRPSTMDPPDDDHDDLDDLRPSRPTSDVAVWRDKIVDAVLAARRAAKHEALHIVGQYARSQLDILKRALEDPKRLSPEEAINAPLPPPPPPPLDSDDQASGEDTKEENLFPAAFSPPPPPQQRRPRRQGQGRHAVVARTIRSGTWSDDGDEAFARTRLRLSGRRSPPPPSAGKKATVFPINGAYVMTRRGGQQDALFISESTSFSARTVASANVGHVFVDVLDAKRAVLYFDDGGFMPHRFVGALDTPTRTRFLADRPDNRLVVLDTLSLSNDGATLVLSIAAPETGSVFYRTEWRLARGKGPGSKRGNVLEQRTRWTTHVNVATSSLLMKRDYDLYERMSPEAASNLELAVT